MRHHRWLVLLLGVLAPATAGSYELVFSSVQERFLWCDEVVPGLGARLPVSVQGPPTIGAAKIK